MGVAYRLVYIVHAFLLFIVMMLLDILYTELWLVWLILLSICIIGGWDWPGVGIGVSIRIWCLFHPSAPRPYIWTGWSVVCQTDGPCQIFCRNCKSILNLNLTFREIEMKKTEFYLISYPYTSGPFCHTKLGNQNFLIKLS